MIRFTWMQFRVQALLAAAGLTVVAVALAVTGPHLVHLYDTTVANCGAPGRCSTATSALIRSGDKLGIVLKVVVEIVPALVGLFWGAPLVARELESGTYRLAWTQVTRARWMGVKLGVIGLASMVVAGVISLMVTWWSSPLDRVRMTPFTSFDQRDLVPVGYAAFAFVLGAGAGLVIRRTLPAMAVALGGFVAARLFVGHWVRPHLIAPSHKVVADTTIATGSSVGAPDPRDWVISDQTVNARGEVIGQFGEVGPNGNTTASVAHGITINGVGSCPNLHSETPHNVQRCVNQLRIREMLTYQPVGHYWALQWSELAIYLGAAIVVGGLCMCWVVRRLV
jgi:hypothetical protein